MKSTALVLVTTGIVLAASMVQTDWSGGPSGEVTTTDWGSDFGSCSGMGWQVSGSLTLGTAMKWARVYDNAKCLPPEALPLLTAMLTQIFSSASSSSIGAILSTGNQNQWSHSDRWFR